MKLHIEELMIEMTRRCNMSCSHCLRGEAENLDMSYKYQDMFLDRIDRIYAVNFSGGEPSLNPGAIFDFIELCKSKNIGVGHYYISTNAYNITDEFLLAITRLDNFCGDNFISKINISTDKFHDLDPVKAENFISKLHHSKIEASIDYDPFGFEAERSYLREGCYADNYSDGVMFKPEKFTISNGSDISGELIYLNCEGNLVPGCGWSYNSQRNIDNVICSVDANYLEAINTFNERCSYYQS